ncbi:GntR family transcriptional regulator [Pseudarthrobacter sp902506025]|uniref:GntR family transcriptional regulator n=1 Tax=Pseudarthrobacter defluvii TaxID=410837 RepID=A0ABT9UMG4_9MICC|nr:GntR family transcriptional regulator [Pseudarthrobacter defluvii]MDQ0120842.1 GntR family transcriptional regulator [Pseudarthrobacter defluvii]
MAHPSDFTTRGDQRLPLHVRVKDDLVRRVRANEWSSDAPLPPESALAEQYGISVGTLRRVLSELSAEGLLERHQGRGTFVRRATFQHSLFRFFRMQGSSGQTPGSRILASDTIEAPADIAQVLHVGSRSKALHMERLRLWDDTPFLLEDIWLPLPWFQAVADADPQTLGNLLYPEYETRVGVIIGAATEELSVTQATSHQANLLNCAIAEPLVKIIRIARTHTGDVAEYRESYGLASSFRYQVEIN